MPEQAATIEPVFPDARMNLVKPTAPVVGRVVSSELCMNGKSNAWVRHLAIDVSGTPIAGNFLVGQSFGVISPGLDEKGKPHKVRLYSIACPSWGEDGQGQVISTTPKRLIDERKPQREGDDDRDHSLFLGVCSNFLCDVDAGDEVMVSGPSGKRFLLPVDAGAHNYVFFATGTGIAPFRGMVLELLERPGGPVKGDVHLLMGTPYTSDLLYHDLFTSLAEKHPNFHYEWAISRERRPDGGRGIYVDKLLEIHEDRYRAVLGQPGTLLYICGLLGMQVGIYRNLARLGVAEAYLEVKDEVAGVDPAEWTAEQIKRHIRPTRRCMVEVY